MSYMKNKINTCEVEEQYRERYKESFLKRSKRQGNHFDLALFGKRCTECKSLLKKVFKSFIGKEICEECYGFEQGQFERADMLGK